VTAVPIFIRRRKGTHALPGEPSAAGRRGRIPEISVPRTIRIRSAGEVVAAKTMLDLSVQALESLEEITQNESTRRIFLRMAEMQRSGRMRSFLSQLADDPDVDDDTKGSIREIAQDVGFLLAVEEYCAETNRLH
jgi:hypothetical protein